MELSAVDGNQNQLVIKYKPSELLWTRIFHDIGIQKVYVSVSHLRDFCITDKLCLKIPNTQLLSISTSHAQFHPKRNQRREERRYVLPGPSMKPTAWQALVLAMALVRSVREVAPAIYDRTTATFP